MNAPTLNTFDEKAAAALAGKNEVIVIEKIQVPVVDLRTVIAEYANDKFPDFLSLDTEGFDEQILRQVDFDTNYPKVICVETLEYTNDGNGQKDKKLIDFLLEKNYMLYADTYINSIFANRSFWS